MRSVHSFAERSRMKAENSSALQDKARRDDGIKRMIVMHFMDKRDKIKRKVWRLKQSRRFQASPKCYAESKNKMSPMSSSWFK